MKDLRKTIIVYGNCQAQLIAACLESVPFLRDRYTIVWERNVDHPGWGERKDLSGDEIRNCAFLFELLGRQFNEFSLRSLLPRDCVILRLPYLKLMCLWPFAAVDPRNKPELKYAAGRFPYGDRIVIEQLKMKREVESIYDEYMKTDVKDHIDLADLYQSDLERIKAVDEKCDIEVLDLIRDQFKTVRLFNTFGHPSDALLKSLIFEILERAGLTCRKTEQGSSDFEEGAAASRDIITGVEKFFAEPRLDAIQVPIHPQVCEHFGLKWVDRNTRYRYYDFGPLTFEEYMKLYISYEEPGAEEKSPGSSLQG